MITWKSPQFPDFTSREKNGILIGFLSNVNLQQQSFGILFCEACNTKIISEYKILTRYVSDIGCEHTYPADITFDDALLYIEKCKLLHFLNEFHVLDQYAYVNELILDEYGIVYQTSPFFCARCRKLELSLYFSEEVDFHVCDNLSCHSEFCGECIKTQNCVASRNRKFSVRSLYYSCVCYKHDKLFDALYAIIYIESYYEN